MPTYNPTDSSYRMPVTPSRYSRNVYTQDYLGQVRPDSFMGEAASPWMNRDNTDGGFSWWDSMFNPQKVQDYSFAQEMVAKDYENWYNHPVQQMDRYKAAGINLNLAAQGIAGSPAQMSDASAGVTPSAAPVGDVVAAGRGVTSSLKDVAEAYKAFEEGQNVTPLAENEIKRTDAEIDKWAHDNGFTDAQTEAFNIDNQTRDEINKADLNIKLQQKENMIADADKIKSQKAYIDKQVEWYDEQITAEIDLSKKRALESEKRAFLAEEQARTEKMENDFAEKYHYRRDQPFDNAVLSMWMHGDYERATSAQEFMYKHKYEMSYNEAEGQNVSRERHASKIASAEAMASALAQVIQDWNAPAHGLWEMLEKSFNISGNKNNNASIPNVQDALSNPEIYSQYLDYVSALWMNIESMQEELNTAIAKNELRKVTELSKQISGAMAFAREFTFSEYCARVYGKDNDKK